LRREGGGTGGVGGGRRDGRGSRTTRWGDRYISILESDRVEGSVPAEVGFVEKVAEGRDGRFGRERKRSGLTSRLRERWTC
jgi:hypothetical protein